MKAAYQKGYQRSESYFFITFTYVLDSSLKGKLEN